MDDFEWACAQLQMSKREVFRLAFGDGYTSGIDYAIPQDYVNTHNLDCFWYVTDCRDICYKIVDMRSLIDDETKKLVVKKTLIMKLGTMSYNNKALFSALCDEVDSVEAWLNGKRVSACDYKVIDMRTLVSDKAKKIIIMQADIHTQYLRACGLDASLCEAISTTAKILDDMLEAEIQSVHMICGRENKGIPG